MSFARGPHRPKQAQREVTSVSVDRAVVRQMAADPGRVVLAEGGAGDDLEQLRRHARDREVALDPAVAVQHLGVGDLADLARDAVVAEALEQLGRPGPGDLELAERGLVEQARALARAQRLGADRRRPVHARPAARAQGRVAVGGVGLVPVDPLPAGLLAEGGAVLGVPFVGGRQPQRPARPGARGRGSGCRSRSRRPPWCASACSSASGSAGRSGGCPSPRRRARARRRRSTRPSACRCRRRRRARARRSRRRRRGRGRRSRRGRTRCRA